MDKLRLLRQLNDNGLFACLTAEELRLFLLMIACSRENGDGEILLSRIRWIIGSDFNLERLNEISCALEKKHLIRITCRPISGARRHAPTLAYRIISSSPESGNMRG